MKASTVIAVAAALTGSIVSAQFGNIPQCAIGCAITSLGTTGCQPTDVKCICQASGFISALTPCVQSACSAAELEQTIQAATGLCASAGVSLVIPSATSAAASSTAVSSAPVTSSAVSTTTEAVSTTTQAMSTTTEAASTLTTSVSSVYVAPNATMTSGSGNGTVTTGSPTGTSAVPTVSPTGNAAARNSVAIGGIVLAFAAALL